MTAIKEQPAAMAPAAILDSLELEITRRCQLACTHCLTSSSPQAPQGPMTLDDWKSVMTDAAHLGIRKLQCIGGEPTTHPHWQQLAEYALSLGRDVEVFTNLFQVHTTWWDLFSRPGMSLGTSYYSDDPAEHDAITGSEGSHARTLANIREALARGIPLRVGIVAQLPDQRTAQAREQLAGMGVEDIGEDCARPVGRAAPGGHTPQLTDLCGWCTRSRAAVLWTGALAGCVLSRDHAIGNLRRTPLAELLAGPEWRALADRVPQPVAECTPQDSECCDPSPPSTTPAH